MLKLTENEQIAADVLIDQLNYQSGMIVVSKIADSTGVSRNVINTMMRKLEAADHIRTTNFGMRGTFVEIIKLW